MNTRAAQDARRVIYSLHFYLVGLICFSFLDASPVSSFTDVTVTMNYGLFTLKAYRVADLLKILGDVSRSSCQSP